MLMCDTLHMLTVDWLSDCLNSGVAVRQTVLYSYRLQLPAQNGINVSAKFQTLPRAGLNFSEGLKCRKLIYAYFHTTLKIYVNSRLARMCSSNSVDMYTHISSHMDST